MAFKKTMMSFINKSGDVVKCRISVSKEKEQNTVDDKYIKKRVLNLSFDNTKSYNRKTNTTPKFKENNKKKISNIIPLPKQPKKNTDPLPRNHKERKINTSIDIRPESKKVSKIDVANISIDLSRDINISKINRNDIPFPMPIKINKMKSKDSCSTADSKRKLTPKLLVNHPSFNSLFK
jgi:hypothetical protein